MSLKQTSPVEIPASQGCDDEAVMMRLKTLFQLALAIGGREGLLGNKSDANGTVSAKNATGSRSDEVKAASPKAPGKKDKSANRRPAPLETTVP